MKNPETVDNQSKNCNSMESKQKLLEELYQIRRHARSAAKSAERMIDRITKGNRAQS